SVPKRCSPKGARNGRPTWRKGLPGKAIGAVAATRTMRERIAAPIRAARLVTKRRQNVRITGPEPSSQVNARIEKRVGKVHREIDDDDERSEEHTSELQSLAYLVCRLLLEKKQTKNIDY